MSDIKERIEDKIHILQSKIIFDEYIKKTNKKISQVMEERFNSTISLRKANGSIDSIQVIDVDEAISNLKAIGVFAKHSTEYEDEIDIVQITNKSKFIEWFTKEHYKLSTYPRLRKFLK